MTNKREQLSQLLESLEEEYLDEVLDLVRVLLREPDELTEAELREVEKGEEEIRRGDWVRWEDVKRTDV